MPMELLEELADTQLPVTVSNPSRIDKVRILATVFQITPLGYKALRYFAPARLHHSSANSSAGFGHRGT
jgi:hypothetical protein